jgi:hypothetical protein
VTSALVSCSPPISWDGKHEILAHRTVRGHGKRASLKVVSAHSLLQFYFVCFIVAMRPHETEGMEAKRVERLRHLEEI